MVNIELWIETSPKWYIKWSLPSTSLETAKTLLAPHIQLRKYVCLLSSKISIPTWMKQIYKQPPERRRSYIWTAEGMIFFHVLWWNVHLKIIYPHPNITTFIFHNLVLLNESSIYTRIMPHFKHINPVCDSPDCYMEVSVSILKPKIGDPH